MRLDDERGAPVPRRVTDHKPQEVTSVIVPQFFPKHIWTEALNARTVDALLNWSGIAVTVVPYQVD